MKIVNQDEIENGVIKAVINDFFDGKQVNEALYQTTNGKFVRVDVNGEEIVLNKIEMNLKGVGM